jgi:hypothetical protein
MLLTTFARRRQLLLWLQRAREAAETIAARAAELYAAGLLDASARFGRAAYRALLYAQRVESALARLR